ncbi:MAG TPA: hypothetical protein VFJ58_27750 [Armatimonadota bacterium]|nr:hypothetical protein [Armatimonadota bacterium]
MDQQDIQDLVAKNKKIAAIKLYRQRYRVGLFEAMSVIIVMPSRQAHVRRRLAMARVSPHEDSEIRRQIEELLRSGDMIQAIKLYRSLTGARIPGPPPSVC